MIHSSRVFKVTKTRHTIYKKLLLVIWVTPDKKLTRSNEKKGDIVTPKKQRMMIYSVDLSLLTIIYVVTCVLLKMEKWKKRQIHTQINDVILMYCFMMRINFRYCEKTKKFVKISQLFLKPIFFWNCLVISKESGQFFQIFVAFSEYLNFTEFTRMRFDNISSDEIILWSFLPMKEFYLLFHNKSECLKRSLSIKAIINGLLGQRLVETTTTTKHLIIWFLWSLLLLL